METQSDGVSFSEGEGHLNSNSGITNDCTPRTNDKSMNRDSEKEGKPVDCKTSRGDSPCAVTLKRTEREDRITNKRPRIGDIISWELCVEKNASLAPLATIPVRANEHPSATNETLNLQSCKALGEKLQLSHRACEQLQLGEKLRTTEEEIVKKIAPESLPTNENNLRLQTLINTLKEEHDEMKSTISKLQLEMEIIQINQKGNQGNKVLEDLLVTMNKEILCLQKDVKDSYNNGLSDSKTDLTPTTQANPPKSPVGWKMSETPSARRILAHVLDCPPLRPGNRYTWSVQLPTSHRNAYQLGVVSTVHELDCTQSLGKQKGVWVYVSSGHARHAMQDVKSNLPSYKSGSKLTFILDLTGNGTLSACHNDDSTNLIEVFDNMTSGMTDFPCAGFLPAITATAKVEFLGFEEDILNLQQQVTHQNGASSSETQSIFGSPEKQVPRSVELSNVKTNLTPKVQSVPPTSRFYWKTTKSSFACPIFCDILDCPPLRSDKRYKWSVRVVTGDQDQCQLGVVSTVHELDYSRALGSQKGGWSYSTTAKARHARATVKSDLPLYKSGSKLTFILDLTGNGTLSAYQDENSNHLIELFGDMKSGMANFPCAGFLPAVTIPSGKVEFLGFEDI